jgi:hypothetical protein
MLVLKSIYRATLAPPRAFSLFRRSISQIGDNLRPSAAIGDENIDSDDEEERPVFRGERPKIKERKVDELGRGYGTGRRKTSVARVWVKEGCGEVVVNDKNIIDYFQFAHRQHCLEVLWHSKTSGFFDVWCTVKGGGLMGEDIIRILSIFR